MVKGVLKYQNVVIVAYKWLVWLRHHGLTCWIGDKKWKLHSIDNKENSLEELEKLYVYFNVESVKAYLKHKTQRAEIT